MDLTKEIPYHLRYTNTEKTWETHCEILFYFYFYCWQYYRCPPSQACICLPAILNTLTKWSGCCNAGGSDDYVQIPFSSHYTTKWNVFNILLRLGKPTYWVMNFQSLYLKNHCESFISLRTPEDCTTVAR